MALERGLDALLRHGGYGTSGLSGHASEAVFLAIVYTEQLGMVFSLTITLGNILEILTIATGGLIFLWQMNTRLSILQNNHDTVARKVDKVEGEVDDLKTNVSQFAAIAERMNAFEQRLIDLNERMVDMNERFIDNISGSTSKRRRKKVPS